MNEHKIIHVHVYDPRNSIFKGSKSDKAEAHYYSCSASDKCDAYAGGRCVMIGKIFGGRCPYGRKNVTTGFTSRARKYHEWMSDVKEKYKEQLWALKSVDKTAIKIGEGFMLPYSFMDMNKKVPFLSHGGGFSTGTPFIKTEDLTTEVLLSIVTFKPQAMMGGEIKDYQLKIVPKFVKDIHDKYPDLFQTLVSVYPEASDLCENYDYTGRKALLSSINPDCHVVISKKAWHWDGEFITATDKDYMIFAPVKWDECLLKFKPKSDESITITSNDQVNENTVFVD